MKKKRRARETVREREAGRWADMLVEKQIPIRAASERI